MKRLFGYLALMILFASFVSAYDVTDTIIILPTTPEVNGIPLHIAEDAIAGSKLGAWLMWNTISSLQIEREVVFPVEYHSLEIIDNDTVFYLTKDVMPDVGLALAEAPNATHLSIGVNFSLVYFNSTSKSVVVEPKGIWISFTSNSSPVKMTSVENATVKLSDDNKKLYVYSHEEKEEFLNINGEISVGKWKIKIYDIDVNSGKALLEITDPYGDNEIVIVGLSEPLVYYVKNGEVVYYNDDVDGALRDGVDNLVKFSLQEIFIGYTRKFVKVGVEYYELAGTYIDGEKFEGDWVWDIINENEFRIVLNKTANLYKGEELEIPVGNLYLRPIFNVTEEGKVTGVKSYIFVRKDEMTLKYTSVYTPLPRPENVILEDTKVDIVTDKNIIVIGGWVSNKYWQKLEELLGKDVVESIKEEIKNEGYVVKVLSNPLNPDYNVVILAGMDYIGTARAVDEFIEQNFV